eukprot:TRINITY_DN6883_c1_g1_i2.p2 TRINITY_DN6883_c1_g1~~TRINITY_DN6883_c1_g1_i2.p2  ORF type:complete len:501 (+),score=82.04 TRINITY_DN6883_c1_g1_i2:141-1505(+)
MHAYEPQEMVDLAWAFGYLVLIDEELFQKMFERVKQLDSDKFTQAQIVSLLQSLGYLELKELRDFRVWICEWLNQNFESLKCSDFPTIVWSLARLMEDDYQQNQNPEVQLIDIVCTNLCQQIENFENEDLVQIISGLGKLKYYNEKLFLRVVNLIVNDQFQLNSKQIVSIVEAFEQTGFYEQKFEQFLVKNVDDICDQCTMSEIATLSFALANSNAFSDSQVDLNTFYDKIQQRSLQLYRKIYPNDYVKLIWSMAINKKWEISWWKRFRTYCEELRNLQLNQFEIDLIYETHLLAIQDKKLHCFSQEVAEDLLLTCYEKWEMEHLRQRQVCQNVKQYVQSILLDRMGLLSAEVDWKLQVGLSKEMQSTVDQSRQGGKDMLVVDLAVFGQRKQILAMIVDDQFVSKREPYRERGTALAVKNIVKGMKYQYAIIVAREVAKIGDWEEFLKERLQLR